MRRVVRTVDDDYVEDDVAVSRSVARPPWSPAQIVAFVAGLFLVVLGGVALARAGLNFGDLEANRVEVLGLGHTALTGLIELVLGLVLLGAAAMPGAERGTMVFVGVLLLGFGIIVAIEPSAFAEPLGTTSANGWFWAILGAILLVASMVAPIIYGRDTVVREHV